MENRMSGRLAQTILKDIRADVHSGATDIARKAVQCLNAFSEEAHASPADYWKDLVGLGRALIAAQPSMASLFNLVNHVLLVVEAAKDLLGIAVDAWASPRRDAGRGGRILRQHLRRIGRQQRWALPLVLWTAEWPHPAAHLLRLNP